MAFHFAEPTQFAALGERVVLHALEHEYSDDCDGRRYVRGGGASHFLTTTYVLTGHLSFALASPSTTPDPNTAALLQQAYSSFSITMPNWLTSQTAGGSVNGTTVTYTAHNGDTIDFQVVGEGVNMSALLVIGGGGVLFIALLFLLVAADPPADASRRRTNGRRPRWRWRRRGISIRS